MNIHAPWAALSMLTRLVPPPPGIDARLLQQAVPWYPLAGLAVGLCATLPLLFGLGESLPFLQGWIWVVLSLWSTRCLHWDGWADLSDAWGSGAHGERFHRILKDSHIGAFGVMSLIMGLCLQGLLCSQLCTMQHWSALILAPVTGRTAAVILAAICPAHPDSSLGKLAVGGSSVGAAWILGTLCTILSLLANGPAVTFWTMLAVGISILGLRRLALREGGINGDFFGTVIILGELAGLAATVLA